MTTPEPDPLEDQITETLIRDHWEAVRRSGITSAPWEEVSERTKTILDNQLRPIVATTLRIVRTTIALDTELQGD